MHVLLNANFGFAHCATRCPPPLFALPCRSCLQKLLETDLNGAVTALNALEGCVIGAIGRTDGPKV